MLCLQPGAWEDFGSNGCIHSAGIIALFMVLRMTRIPNGRGQGLGHCCAVPVQQVGSFRSGFPGGLRKDQAGSRVRRIYKSS